MRSLILLGLLVSQFVIASSDKKLNSLSLMTYNLENLFDTTHDKGKKDWTYLPLKVKRTNKEALRYCYSLSNEYYKKSCLELDWNEAKLETKMESLSEVIKLYNHGEGADVLIFQEVENKEVLKTLFKRKLAGMGYKYFSLVEGKDSRGIDVAVVSRYPILSDKAHQVSLKPYSDRYTRHILEVFIKAHGKTVTVFANHWPSQANADETRMVVAERLKQLSLQTTTDLVIATGDFNTVDNDLLNGITTHILPIYEDVEVKGRHFSNVEAPGTHWYQGKWTSLDKIFVLKRSLKKGKVNVNYGKFNIIKEQFMLRDLIWTDNETGEEHFASNVPYRFDSKSGLGYSDHLPVVAEFDL